MKSFFKKLVSWRCFPFLVVFLLMLFLHIIVPLDTKDDLIANSVLGTMTQAQYAAQQYISWSSRQLVEGLMVYLIHFPVLWMLLDSALVALCCYFICSLAGVCEQQGSWLVALLMLSYPFACMGSAGWVVTTMVYLWPTAAGLFTLTSIPRLLRDERIPLWQCAAYTIALIYSANLEQMCAVLFASFALVCILRLKQKKSILLPALFVVLCAGMFVYIFTCPGNALRRINEVNGQFPEFDGLGFLRKTEMGFAATWYEFVMKQDLFFAVFSLLLVMLTAAKKASCAMLCVSSVPLAAWFICGVLPQINTTIFPGLSKLNDCLDIYGTRILLEKPRSWVPNIIFLLVLASIFAVFFYLFEKRTDALACCFALLMGLGARMVMAYSPTIWVSGSRTFIFMYFAFIVCAAMLWRERGRTFCESGRERVFFPLAGTLCSATFLNTVYTVF